MSGRLALDRWEAGDPYERYVGRWSRRVAPIFLTWLGVPAGRRWVDVGCGTGALCGAIADGCAPASVLGVEPSEGFLEAARKNLGGRAEFRVGSAGQLPLADRSVDAVVSALALNFMPDPPGAVRDMVRVTVPAGVIGAYVWDYAEKMEMMRYFWDAAVALDPEPASLDEATRFPICHPEALTGLFTKAGLTGVEVRAIDIPTQFADFQELWQPFLGGQGPAPAYVLSLDEAARERLRERLRSRIPAAPDGTISLVARAWAVRGTVSA
jgi:SAM-dependent methyltransferase